MRPERTLHAFLDRSDYVRTMLIIAFALNAMCHCISIKTEVYFGLKMHSHPGHGTTPTNSAPLTPSGA